MHALIGMPDVQSILGLHCCSQPSHGRGIRVHACYGEERLTHMEYMHKHTLLIFTYSSGVARVWQSVALAIPIFT